MREREEIAMNLYSLLVIILIVFTLWFAWRLYVTHGLSFTTLLAPLVVLGVGWLFLYLFNNFGISAMRTQAEGSVSQMQDLVHSALPAIVSESGQLNVPESIAQQRSQSSQGAQSSETITQLANPQTSLVVPTPIPTSPPKAGDVQQIGNIYPVYGDPLVPLQAQCINRTDIINSLTAAGKLPNGIQLTMWTGQMTFFLPAGAEVWDVRAVLPSAQLAPVHYTVDRATYNAMAKGCGGNTCTGNAAWPTITARFDGNGWVPEQPLQCQFH